LYHTVSRHPGEGRDKAFLEFFISLACLKLRPGPERTDFMKRGTSLFPRGMRHFFEAESKLLSQHFTPLGDAQVFFARGPKNDILHTFQQDNVKRSYYSFF
jgi:hypothetical protein